MIVFNCKTDASRLRHHYVVPEPDVVSALPVRHLRLQENNKVFEEREPRLLGLICCFELGVHAREAVLALDQHGSVRLCGTPVVPDATLILLGSRPHPVQPALHAVCSKFKALQSPMRPHEAYEILEP